MEISKMIKKEEWKKHFRGQYIIKKEERKENKGEVRKKQEMKVKNTWWKLTKALAKCVKKIWEG